MSTQHTPEPWLYGSGKFTAEDGFDHESTHPFHSGSIILSEEDYDRSLSCVNALAGLNPSAIKDAVDKFAELMEAINQGDFSRDEWNQYILNECRQALAALKQTLI